MTSSKLSQLFKIAQTPWRWPLLCPAAPHKVGHVHCWLLSVCPSVCPVPDPKSRTEGHSTLKIGRKEAHDTGYPWAVTSCRDQKVKGQGHQAAWSKITHIFGTARLTKFKLRIRMKYDDPHHQRAQWPSTWKLGVALQQNVAAKSNKKLSWCWQTRATRLEVSQGHQTWCHSIC